MDVTVLFVTATGQYQPPEQGERRLPAPRQKARQHAQAHPRTSAVKMCAKSCGQSGPWTTDKSSAWKFRWPRDGAAVVLKWFSAVVPSMSPVDTMNVVTRHDETLFLYFRALALSQNLSHKN